MCDFAGESIFIAWTPAPHTAMDRTATLLTAGAGNGFYTLAAILLTFASPGITPVLRRWAWLTWTSGIALTVLAILNLPTGVVIASAVLMMLFIPWVVVMGATQ